MSKHHEFRKLALRTLLPGFDGTAPPQWSLDLLEEGLAGYCLFSMNITDSDQLKKLTAQLRQVDQDVIIAVDEEGGDVTRLHSATGSPYPGNAALGAVDDLDLTTAIHHSIGAELAAVGVTVDFAPAVDVNVEDDNPVIGTRSFGRDPHAVAQHARAAVVGLQQAGIAACAKHFPGHGATTVDSHLALPTVDESLSVLRNRELIPFRSVIAADVQLIMSGHIRVPSLTGDSPCTLSPNAMGKLLREELGFTGTIVTDAMEMQGASGTVGIPEAVVQALIAGCDLICTGGERQKFGPMTELVHQIADAVADAVENGRLLQSRLEDAVARVDALRTWQREHLGHHASNGLGPEAARRAIKVEGTLPQFSDPLIIQIESSANIAVGDETQWGVTPLLAKHLPDAEVRHVWSEQSDVDETLALANGRPIIVVARDTHRRAQARDFVSTLCTRADVALVEMGWPAQWRPEGVRAYLATYGAAAPNAQAATERLLGI